jgi:heptosyltransferase-2
VGLLAPEAAGAALLGPGPGEAQELLPWEAAATADLFTGAGPSSTLRGRLGSFDAAVAYSRQPDLLRSLEGAVPRVVAHAPLPAPGAGHAAEWLARPLGLLGVARGEDPPVLEATAEERERAAAVLGQLPRLFLAVHPGSGSPAKSWPADRFARVLDALGPEAFLLVEGPADAEPAARLRARGGAVTARLSARVLGAVLARSAVYVGNDSGVTHLAAAWGAPTVALFGPTDPRVWAPLGPRVTVVRAPGGRMQDLAVEEVTAAVTALRRGRQAQS